MAPAAWAQTTLNIAPRISVQGLASGQRALSSCMTAPAGTQVPITGISVADADIGTAIMEARVLIEPGLAGASTIAIPGLASLPGVVVLRELGDRIRFTAPLQSVNLALAQLKYQTTAPQTDILDVLVDDLQIPPLSTQWRAHIAVSAGAPYDGTLCMPPPDLLPSSDTGVDDDDITEHSQLAFRITGINIGDTVALLDDELLVSQAVATGAELNLSDPSAAPGLTHLYSVSVNANPGSAAWSIAVLGPLFVDGFEAP